MHFLLQPYDDGINSDQYLFFRLQEMAKKYLEFNTYLYMLGEIASTVNGNNDDVVFVLHEGQVRSFPQSLTIEAMKVDDLEIVDKEEREDLHLDFF